MAKPKPLPPTPPQRLNAEDKRRRREQKFANMLWLARGGVHATRAAHCVPTPRRRIGRPMLYALDGHNAVVCDDDPYNWMAVYLDIDARRVALDSVGDAEVSTVFLGIDASLSPRPPRLFETMIFGGARDLYRETYATWDEAAAGHARIVAMLRDAS